MIFQMAATKASPLIIRKKKPASIILTEQNPARQKLNCAVALDSAYGIPLLALNKLYSSFVSSGISAAVLLVANSSIAISALVL